MHRTVFTCALALALGLVSSHPAMAQGEGKSKAYNKATAKAHVAEARRAESRKDWKTAAKEYAIAYKVTKDDPNSATLFYFMAFAYLRGGDCDAAIIYYRRYINESRPAGTSEADKTNHQRTIDASKKNIEQCEKRAGIVRKDPDAKNNGNTGGSDNTDTGTGSGYDPTKDPRLNPTTTQTVITNDGPSWKRTVAWTALGIGAAFATTGAVLGLAARSREDDLDSLIGFRDSMDLPSTFDGTTQQEYNDLNDEGEQLETFSIVAFTAAGAAAVLAISFFVVDGLSGDDEEATNKTVIAPTVTKDSFGVTAGWEF